MYAFLCIVLLLTDFDQPGLCRKIAFNLSIMRFYENRPAVRLLLDAGGQTDSTRSVREFCASLRSAWALNYDQNTGGRLGSDITYSALLLAFLMSRVDGTVSRSVLHGVETTMLSPAWEPQCRSAELNLTLSAVCVFSAPEGCTRGSCGRNAEHGHCRRWVRRWLCLHTAFVSMCKCCCIQYPTLRTSFDTQKCLLCLNVPTFRPFALLISKHVGKDEYGALM